MVRRGGQAARTKGTLRSVAATIRTVQARNHGEGGKGGHLPPLLPVPLALS